MTYIKIETKSNAGGCHLVTSHALNADGYFRKRVNGKLMMYHRYIYEAEVGEIPIGFEIDHLCRNRNCINPEHLQALSRNDHLVKTNQERYADRKREALKYWLINKPKGIELAEVFDVNFGSACRWIREWKKHSLTGEQNEEER